MGIGSVGDRGLLGCEIERARVWYEAHACHVSELLQSARSIHPPSGSDCKDPALWKASSWKWFKLEGYI